MGCDIHVMVEVTKASWDGIWRNVDNWRVNPYYGQFESEPEMQVVPVYHRRDYELFSFLADVRNYGNNPSFGFDRGIPIDASGHTIREYESWGDDAHTPGYCTLKELKQAAASVKAVRREGAVAIEEAEKFRSTGETPTGWAQGVGCWRGIAADYLDRYEWLVWEDEVHCFDGLISAVDERKRDVFYIFDPADDDGRFDDYIRIIFWFDN